MAEELSMPAAPQGETEVTNTNPNPAPTPAQAETSSVNLHGFTEDQLGDLARFMKGQGGFDAFKRRMSNPDKFSQEQPQAQPEQSQPQAPELQPTQPVQPAQPPKGFASLNELSVERYFRDLAHDPKYANISEQIENGEILKEMTSMGMAPIDENYNINVNQLHQFLALKSASVPTKPTSAEPTTIPTVEYFNEGKDITSSQQALQVLQQSFALESRGQAPHPDKAKAEAFLRQSQAPVKPQTPQA